MSGKLSRRSFIKTSTLSTGGMLLSFSFLGSMATAQGKPYDLLENRSFEPNGYLKIFENGTIVLYAPNPEIGQGVKTSLPLIIAEELGVDWKEIEIEYAPVAEKYGRQTAGGSGSVRGRFEELRKVGATAKAMLIEAAATTWNVPMAECIAENAQVKHKPTGKLLSYGALATKASTLGVPENPTLKDPKDFKYIGTRIGDVDAHKIVTGVPLFGIDTRKEGMLFAMVARPPAYGKVLGTVDSSETMRINGVKQVVQLENSVAVIATSTWQAKKGRDALNITWTANGKLESSEDHISDFKTLLEENSPARRMRNDGDVDAAAQNAVSILDVIYELPALSHGQMEPLNFYADVKENAVELFGPTQVPAQLKKDVSEKLNIALENITINSPRQGGGFGRKLMTDSGVEAALISAAIKQPVQVQWLREDDMQNDFYRPAEMHRFRAALSTDSLLSWHQTGVSLSGGVRGDSYIAGTIANYRSESIPYKSNIPTGWWRAPGANTMAFVGESFMDEVCIALKKDPVQFRLDIFNQAQQNPVGESARYDAEKYRSVVNLVAKMANWGETQEGIFRGFATWFSFGSYAAQVVDLKIIDGTPRVIKVYSAINCGRVINKSGAENQVEGAIVDGICHAMYPKITFRNGAVKEKNFYSYKFLRMKDAPLEIEVQFVPSNEAPTGLGEPGLPPVAPALANAIFAATGKRIRKMPFAENLN